MPDQSVTGAERIEWAQLMSKSKPLIAIVLIQHEDASDEQELVSPA